MKLVLQRVSRASVSVAGRRVAEIDKGLLVLLAVENGDSDATASAAARKVAGLRVFPEPGGAKMNRSVCESGGAVLVVSQFTLAASIRRGRRPSFDAAAPPEEAARLCAAFARALEAEHLLVRTGEFGAMMEVELINDGPVTIWMESGADGEMGP